MLAICASYVLIENKVVIIHLFECLIFLNDFLSVSISLFFTNFATSVTALCTIRKGS